MIRKDLGLYIHIPFCLKKCDYCDFTSAVGTAEEQAFYTRALIREIRSYSPICDMYNVDTIFFGGGTPSALDPILLTRIMNQIKDQFDIMPESEITIECNPGTLTEEKLACYRELGFNRISLGLQSVHDDELRLLGRIHTYDQFLKNYELVREAGFRNVNIDLMSALPDQTFDLWKTTLMKVADLEPEHISAYSLSIERGTPFYDRYTSPEGAKRLPDEDTERDIYHYTGSFLESRGYHRYEISNYARKGRESRHNIKYWELDEYLGFGQSASSYLGGKRFTNPKLKTGYMRYADEAYARFRTRESQPDKEAIEEFMFLGLRMMRGVSPIDFEERFHISFDGTYGKAVRHLKDIGLLEEKDGRYRLTERGIDVSNRVLAEFLL